MCFSSVLLAGVPVDLRVSSVLSFCPVALASLQFSDQRGF